MRRPVALSLALFLPYVYQLPGVGQMSEKTLRLMATDSSGQLS